MNSNVSVGKVSAARRNGRKRPRNESFGRNSSCTNTFLLPLTVAGIAVVCSQNTTGAFAFHHSAAFQTRCQQFQDRISNEKDNRLRNRGSQRHERRRTPTTCWTAGDILDEQEKVGNSRSSSSSSSQDLSLVVASSPASSSSSSLPPWLALVEEECSGLASLSEASKRIRREIEHLEAMLLSFRGGNFFSKADVGDVIRAIYWSASSSPNSEDRNASQKLSKLLGSVSFCRLLLQLESDTFDANEFSKDNGNNKDNKSYLITKDVLLASILHYSECIDLRYDGVYDELRQAVSMNALAEGSDDDAPTSLAESYNLAMLSKSTDDENDETTDDTAIVLSNDEDNDQRRQDSAIVIRGKSMNDEVDDTFETIFSREALELANAASRLKRIEILTSVTLTDHKDGEKRRRPLKKEEYAAARNLMVSVADDWRALAIRCVASLYRLEGILKNSKINAGTGQFSTHSSWRGAETTLAAKDSLKMYANLSQQMGLHRLQSQLEAKAFRILYPRQYSASSVLFQEHGTAMNAISGFLSNQLKQLLAEDLSLMYELENLEVVSRVKEPYSFWRKLVRKRIGDVGMSASTNEKCEDSNDDNRSEQEAPQRQIIRSTPEFPILEINDVVALRIIIKARKLHVDEPSQTTRERERLLCYYIHQMVRSKWPETDLNRVKDYIRYPKANGYQSLHHTSKITRNMQDFFFEVQVRSEEMHRLAEFGVAAHSAYKLGGSSSPSVYPSLKASGSSSSLILPQSTEVSSNLMKNLDSIDQSSALTFVSKEENSVTSGYEFPVLGVSDSGNSRQYIHALEKTRQALMKSHAYVFLAGGLSPTVDSGQLLTLSAGSLIIDVLESLREINKEIAFKNDEVQVWCNGNLALLEDRIENGDTIVIKPVQSLILPNTEILVNKTSSSKTMLVS